jgi:8-oxo-dGTP diphosphatase
VDELSQARPSVVLAVGAVVVDGTGRVLLVQRGRPPAVGSWSLPGGRVEAGEAPEAAIVREAREETALRTRVECELGTVLVEREGFRYAVHEFLLVSVGGTSACAGDDASDLCWASTEDFERLGVTPEILAVIARGLAEARRRGLTA